MIVSVSGTNEDQADGTEAAVRVADVLLMFTDGSRSLGVTGIGRQLGLSKAVVHRILRSLASRGLVVSDPATRGYRLGPAAVVLGARALRESTVRSAASPVLRRLRDQTGETTTLSEMVGDTRVYIQQFESPQEIKMTVEVGRRFPLHAGASSKVILAYLSADRREAVLAEALPRLTARTVTDAGRLRAELAEIARLGVAVSRGERQRGAGSVAAPLFDVDGAVIGGISVCGPVDRFDDGACARHVPLMRAAGEEISRALGWSAPSPASAGATRS